MYKHPEDAGKVLQQTDTVEKQAGGVAVQDQW
jgi:hypothetical protein